MEPKSSRTPGLGSEVIIRVPFVYDEVSKFLADGEWGPEGGSATVADIKEGLAGVLLEHIEQLRERYSRVAAEEIEKNIAARRARVREAFVKLQEQAAQIGVALE